VGYLDHVFVDAGLVKLLEPHGDAIQVFQFFYVILGNRAVFLMVEDEEEGLDVVLADLDLFPHLGQKAHYQIFKLLVVKLHQSLFFHQGKKTHVFLLIGQGP
jgi:hypothetical protein